MPLRRHTSIPEDCLFYCHDEAREKPPRLHNQPAIKNTERRRKTLIHLITQLLMAQTNPAKSIFCKLYTSRLFKWCVDASCQSQSTKRKEAGEGRILLQTLSRGPQCRGLRISKHHCTQQLFSSHGSQWWAFSWVRLINTWHIHERGCSQTLGDRGRER